jgi:excisionase family DNA binding protein
VGIDANIDLVTALARSVAAEVATILKQELAKSSPAVEPILLTVKTAAVYLGRSEQSIQHLIFQKELPVVRIGRRVHLDRRDLDEWIEKNKY